MKTKKSTKKERAVSFQPGIVAFLVALVSALSILLLADLGVIFSA